MEGILNERRKETTAADILSIVARGDTVLEEYAKALSEREDKAASERATDRTVETGQAAGSTAGEANPVVEDGPRGKFLPQWGKFLPQA